MQVHSWIGILHHETAAFVSPFLKLKMLLILLSVLLQYILHFRCERLLPLVRTQLEQVPRQVWASIVVTFASYLIPVLYLMSAEAMH